MPRRWPFFCVSLLPLLAVGCVVEKKPPVGPKVEFSEDDVQVATYDPAGRPTRGVALADQVWGAGGGRQAVEPVPWDVLRDGAGEDAVAAPGGEIVVDVDQPSVARAEPPPAGPVGQDPVPQRPAPAAEGEQDPEGPMPQESPEERRRREALMRTTFGDAILIGDDGRITKQFFLSDEAGYVFQSLIRPLDDANEKPPVIRGGTFGGEAGADRTVLDRLLGESEVDVIFLERFEQIQNVPIQATNNISTAKAQPGSSNSLVLVTARPSALRQFERALDLFYANIPQIEIEVQVVEFTVSDSLSLGTAPLDNNTPTLGSTNSGTLVQEIVSNFPLSAPFLGSSSINDSGILRLSAIQNGWELNALLQALENNQIADIKSEPKLVVRNGGTATIATTTELPFPQAQISNQTVVSSSIQFKKVGIVLNIRPEIAGTDTVILQVYASVSAVSSFAATEPVPTPIIATREATTSVYLKRGEAAVIGGLVTQNTFETESKIPLLGDIPILGLLFRSSSTQTQRTDLQFFITPRIVTGSRGVRGGFGG
jgi:hypothetical protein